MPFYQKQGEVPNKRHIQFRDNNESLYYEELISRKGFSSLYSNAYHINPPTAVKKVGKYQKIKKDPLDSIHRHYHCLLYTSPSPRD